MPPRARTDRPKVTAFRIFSFWRKNPNANLRAMCPRRQRCSVTMRRLLHDTYTYIENSVRPFLCGHTPTSHRPFHQHEVINRGLSLQRHRWLRHVHRQQALGVLVLKHVQVRKVAAVEKVRSTKCTQNMRLDGPYLFTTILSRMSRDGTS